MAGIKISGLKNIPETKNIASRKKIKRTGNLERSVYEKFIKKPFGGYPDGGFVFRFRFRQVQNLV